jgi:hypothetical protein
LEEKLIDYIKKEREKGFNDEAIRKALENVGYTPDRLDYVFQELPKLPDSSSDSTDPGEVTNNESEPKQTVENVFASFYNKERKTLNIVFMILAIIVVVICFILLLNFIWSGDDTGQETNNPGLTQNLPQGQKPIAQNNNAGAAKGYYYDDINYKNLSLEGAGCGYEDRRVSRLCRAVFKSDEKICDAMEDDYDKISCKDYVKITKATVGNDKTSCNGLSTDVLKTLCGAAIDKNKGICDSAPDGSQKEKCNSAFAFFGAIQTKDASVCDSSIIEDKDKGFCKTMISNSNLIGKSIEPCRKYYDIRCP